MAGVFLYSRNSVNAALEDAINLGVGQQAEKSRRITLTNVLEHLHEGVVAVDARGRVVAANPAAREHGLPATVAAYAPMLEDLRLMAADGGIVACTLPGGPRGHYDGHLRAVHDANADRWRRALGAGAGQCRPQPVGLGYPQ
ncbi:hypothetical protein G6F62_014288 [Rhizopus arrhizus]|nr:hypothetical protein G6F62_014288 [Rhizopus arrhizus]